MQSRSPQQVFDAASDINLTMMNLVFQKRLKKLAVRELTTRSFSRQIFPGTLAWSAPHCPPRATLVAWSVPYCSPRTTPRFFYTSRSLGGSATAASSSATDKAPLASTAAPKKKDEKNLFLDNLGTIFLSAIGLIIAYLVRSYIGSTRRNTLRGELESKATLDPLEIDELRRVNPELTASVFRDLVEEVWAKHPSGELTYNEFTETIRETLVHKHKVPTVEFGHLLDRVVIFLIEKQGDSSSTPQPISLWMTVLSLALNSPISDRVRVLHEVLVQEALHSSVSSGTDDASATVNIEKVRRMVQYLQDTDQLVLETQLFPTPDKAYPIQQYHRGTPDELVSWEGSDSEPIDFEAFAALLRSRAVCAWGECYRKSYKNY